MILARAVSVEIVSKNITGLYVKKKRGTNMRCKGVVLLHRHAEKWYGKWSKKITTMGQMNTDSEKLLV